MRKLIIALAFLLGLVFIFINLAEVQDIAATLQRGDWRFLLLALVVQALWLLNLAVTYWAFYRSLGINEDIGRLYLTVSAANFVNIVAPSVGVGGLAIFITEARRRGYSTARVTIAGGLVVFFDYIGFLCVLGLGLIVLFRRNNLNATELGASGILVLVATIFGLIIYAGMRSGKAMGRILAWMARQVNRFLLLFLHREYLSEKRAYEFAGEASSGLRELRQTPNSLILPAALSLINKVLLILILLLVFLAFDVPFTAGTLIAGFSIGYLFQIVSPTPAGIGFVEGALTLGLHSLNVPLGDATVIALSYRGITFWLPLLLGMFAFRWLSHDDKVEAAV
jgi:uncharacterized protein (TIRG00374 family)